jgi:sugar lactone lactonase YvrE
VQWTADGDVSEEYALPVPNITSVAFGGPSFGSLFIGSAREQLTEADLVTHPLSGGIFRLDVGATGRPPNLFGG